MIGGIIFGLGNIVAFAGGLENRGECSAFDEITIDGKALQLEKEPFSIDGNRMIPLRNVCENLGCNISWDGEAYKIKVTRDDDTLLIGIGDNTIVVNGQAKKMRVAPIIVGDRTYVTPAILQVGLGDEVKVNYKGDFEITNKSKMNKQSGIKNIRKTIYKEDEDGYVIGLAQINVPHIYDVPYNFVYAEENCEKINQYFEDSLKRYSEDELKSELRWCNKELVDTIYLDYKVVLYRGNIISVKEPHFVAGCYRDYVDTGIMFRITTGDRIKNSEIFKEYHDSIYDALMHALENNDKSLIDTIEKLKTESEYDRDILNVSTYEEGVKEIADRLMCMIYKEDSSGDCWLSGEDDDIELNFRYYGPLVDRYVGFNAREAVTYLDEDFVLNIWPMMSL